MAAVDLLDNSRMSAFVKTSLRLSCNSAFQDEYKVFEKQEMLKHGLEWPLRHGVLSLTGPDNDEHSAMAITVFCKSVAKASQRGIPKPIDMFDSRTDP